MNDWERTIDRAAAALRAGQLVAFPTETVYGLGADARQPDAVARIFAAKGRPATNPLIVHVADTASARQWTTGWDDRAQRLAELFWPGPLTLVLPRHPVIAPQVSAGLSTVGLRVPRHPVALELLRRFDGPVAAPSANRSNRVSPTSADHVRAELGDAVEVIVDGGACAVGIESTVLDLTTDEPRILRPGDVTPADLEPHIGPVVYNYHQVAAHQPANSPGQHEKHYAPRTPSYRVERDRLANLLAQLPDPARCVLLAISADARNVFNADASIAIEQMPADPKAYARDLYAALRKVDSGEYARLFIELPPDEPAWAAVRDRLRRATQPM